jgi:histone H3/H4
MKNIIKLTEQDLRGIVENTVKKILKEAESGGWVVDSSEAQEAYNLAVQEMGEETINSAIVRCLGDETLAQCLAYIFRQYDFRQWKSKYE